MSVKLRIHQFLSKTGAFNSKQQIYDALKSKQITVDGEIITNPQYQIKKSAFVLFGKKRMELVSENSECVYLLLNKPAGYLCSRLTKKDSELEKKSIFSFIDSLKTLSQNVKNTLFCVGRLDEDTSGLMIITNDGDLSHKITSPDSKVSKTYFANLKLPISHSDKRKIEEGIKISMEENGEVFSYTTRPCKLKLSDDALSCEIGVTEGKKREVRRIFEAIGNEVLLLKRIAIGELKLDELNIKEGQFKSVDKNFLLDKIYK